MTRHSRRDFLQSSAVGAASVGLSYFVGNTALGQRRRRSPNDEPTLGFVGCGIRYHNLIDSAVNFGPCAALCDVDAVQLGRGLQSAMDAHDERRRSLAINRYEDYRRILDRDDVDVVLITTPDHWHTKIAVEAMQAGKDVYCEKPLTLTIREGQQLIEAIEKTNRIVQVGTQQRTEFNRMFAQAAAMVRDGRAGKLERVTAAIGGSMECEALPVAAPLNSFNWELWQGQTPVVEYRSGEEIIGGGYGAGHPYSRAHNYFRWWYEYSGGKLTDWGAHHVDIAMWAMDLTGGPIGTITIEPEEATHPVPLENGMPTLDDRFNVATAFNAKVSLPGDIELRVRDTAEDELGFDNGIMFEGSEGRFFVNRGRLTGRPVEELKEKPLPEDALEKLYGCPPPESHFHNFFECVKTRNQPISDVPSHHRAISICHAINIAMRLGRTLQFDTESEQFVGDEQASSFIAREQRKGYEIKV